MTGRWPEHLWIVRHGQSSGNVARDKADQEGLASIDITERDMDVPLSALGREQSIALGKWFAAMAPRERPTAVLVSPYLRAKQTADAVRESGGTHPHAQVLVDERLREKEFGILDRLTRAGIVAQFPDQASARDRFGKFYHRPPGGESWCDVILRLRSVLDSISLHYSRPGARVLIVAHQVIVLCFRYLLENLDEEQILAIDRQGDVANCGVTDYIPRHEARFPAAESATPVLKTYNFVAPLIADGAPVTAAPDPVPDRR